MNATTDIFTVIIIWQEARKYGTFLRCRSSMLEDYAGMQKATSTTRAQALLGVVRGECISPKNLWVQQLARKGEIERCLSRLDHLHKVLSRMR